MIAAHRQMILSIPLCRQRPPPPTHMVMSPLCRGAGWTRHACRLAVLHRRLSRESGRMEWMMISGSLLLIYIFEIVSLYVHLVFN